MQQLLWIETLLKLAGGLALVLAPLTVIRLLGLPEARSGFWPRLLGSVLIGLAAATFLEGTVSGSRGLGLAGSIAVNLFAAAMIAVLLALEAGPSSRRGAVLLWLLAATLILLSLFEIAYL